MKAKTTLFRWITLAGLMVVAPGFFGATVSVLRPSVAQASEGLRDELDDYVKNVHRKIAEQARRHQLAVEVDVSTTVVISVNRYGAIRDVRFLQSSGYQEIESEVMRIVHQAAPFGPLPKAFDAPYLELEVPVVFHDGYPGCA